MCGIVGYAGNKSVESVLMVGLACLEYRGYDSAGIAVIDNDEIEIFLAIAKAQVDVGALHPYIYQFVRIIIETGTSLRLLKELGADELFLAERKEVLEQFLQIMKNQMNETRKPGQ